MGSFFHFPTEKKRRVYEKLTTADKEKIQGILFIMDKFSISWEAYHDRDRAAFLRLGGLNKMPKAFLARRQVQAS